MNIDEVFKYHAPFGTQTARYELLRAEARILAALIDRNCPDSREKSTALTNLQQAIMWANASIAINEAGNMQGECNAVDPQWNKIADGRLKEVLEKERVQYKDRAGL